MSPHDAFAILQGVETLGLRMERHVATTRRVVEFLAAQPMVASVSYPEMDSHPDRALAQRLLPQGCGAVLGFELNGGPAAGRRFADGLQVFSQSANRGDARSSVIHPASPAGLLCLSIGLEDPDDLIDDLKRGLKLAQKGA